MSKIAVQITVEQFEELVSRVVTLEEQIKTLSTKSSTNASQREMTDEDAISILNGSHKDMKHNRAAEELGLSYGQVYSCRLGYTFRNVHETLKSQGFTNPWKK